MLSRTIWLIRHGESAANVGLATKSPALIPLTELGHRQAGLVAETFPIAPDLIITSPYLRAKQTSEPTIKRFSSTQVEEWPVEEFTYLSLGDSPEMTSAERRPLVEQYWNRCDENYGDGPGAESFAAFIDRTNDAITRLRSSEHQSIAVFSHGQFIRAIMWLLLVDEKKINSSSMNEFEHFLAAVPFANGAILELSFDKNDFLFGPIRENHLK